MSPEQFNKIQELIRDLLRTIGEDPDREGLQRTPYRVAKAYKYLLRGYEREPRELFEKAVFVEDYDEMIVVRDIDFYSLCEHHLLPFFGKCHIAYIPSDRIVGLSKLARLVDIYSRRLQVQERLTSQIARTIEESLKPIGVGVVIEAQHLCMMMRGVEKQNSLAVTSAMLGAFRTSSATRAEFLGLVRARPASAI